MYQAYEYDGLFKNEILGHYRWRLNDGKKQQKRKISKTIIKQRFDVTDEDELIEMLLDNPTAIDSDKEEDERRTMGDKLADKVTEIAGSWGFIVGFCIFLIVWMIINTIMIVKFDEYPFILLNLILSCIAALQAPIIMMSQNRAAKKDSLRSLNDYKTDLKSELILEVLHEQMKDLQVNQKKILKLLEENDVKQTNL